MADEDLVRARFYGLFAALLNAAPDQAALADVARLHGDEDAGDGDFGAALTTLGRAAGEADAAALNGEFHDLFIGVGAGELLPYASYYLTGFLQEKPLAELRDDMAPLGIAVADDSADPEDHIAALSEMMAGLISGAFGAPADLATQRRFFETHIESWAPRFFRDLETAKAADFYAHVGRLGRRFLAIETQAFAMASGIELGPGLASELEPELASAGRGRRT